MMDAVASKTMDKELWPLDLHGAGLAATDFSGANLSGANLSNVDASGAKFTGAKS